MTSYDKKEDDYKDLALSVHVDESLDENDSCYIIHGNVLPTKRLVKAILSLKPGEFIASSAGVGIAFHITKAEVLDDSASG